jgi:iron complex outermembrane recepter protein
MKNAFGATVVIIGSTLTVAGGPQLATAQQATPAASGGGGIEEVVVTARRREENLQQVPTAVTAIGPEQLQDLRIENFGEIGQSVPNHNIQQQFGSASSPQMFLRGVATGSLKFETDAGVALYVDGVYLGRPAGTAFDIADISRIEVLRGPQGTLFGRNSTGGAINIVTAAPTGQFGVVAEGDLGNFSDRRAKVTINLPDFAGIDARVTYLHEQHNGYVTRSGPVDTYDFAAPFGTVQSANSFGSDNTDAVGVALKYRGGDHFSLDYKFDYTDKTSSQLGAQMLGEYGFFNPSTLLPGSNLTTVTPNYQTSLPIDTSETHLQVQGHSLTGAYEFSPEVTLKNILAYRQFWEGPNFNDIDGNQLRDSGISSASLGIPGPPFVIGGSGNPFAWISSVETRAQHQWSDELQLLGTSGNFDWIAGAFFFKENGWDNNPVFLFVPFAPNKVYSPGITNASILGESDYAAGSNYWVDNKSMAGYLHGTYRFTDQWELSAGARYSKDDRGEHIIQSATISNEAFSKDFSKTVWDASLTYKVTPAVNVYGKVSTGYLTGGVLGGSVFQPETITAYELGLKSDLLDNHLRLNLSVFRDDRKNLQVLTFSDAAGTQLADGGNTTQDGVEIEATYAPIDRLRLSVSYGYLHSENQLNIQSIVPSQNAFGALDWDFARFPSGGGLTAHIDVSWRSNTYGLSCPPGATLSLTKGCTDLAASDPTLNQEALMKGYALLGGRLGYVNIPMGSMTGEVDLWGQNLLNEHQLEFTRDLGNGTVIGTFQAPRTYGLELKVQF